MCLIVAKPAGVKVPSNKKFRTWLQKYPDGAGMMFDNGNGRVHIIKGVFEVDDFFHLQAKLARQIKPLHAQDVNIVYHFRQATEGQISPSNCHPFPITKDKTQLVKTELTTDRAIVHNGIIWDYDTGTQGTCNLTTNKTDTQKFIEDCLVDMGELIRNESVKHLIARYTASRFAALDKDGIIYIGKFIEDDGLLYSNGGYKEPEVTVKSYQDYELPSKGMTAYKDLDDWIAEDDYSKYDIERCDVCDEYVPLDGIKLLHGSYVCNECMQYVIPG